MKETIARVKEIKHFGRSYCQIKLVVDEELNIEPGQFAMLKPAGAFEPLLRRAMAFYQVNVTRNETYVDFIFNILGRGTQALAQMHVGDKVEFLGPLGKSFSILPAKTTQNAIIVAGGVGTPAVLMLAQDLCKEKIETTIFLGARSEADLIGMEDFSQLPAKLFIATDDGSVGDKGFVTSSLEKFLETQKENKNFNSVIYTCGPEIMMETAAKIGLKYNLKTYASLEARMACGFGVCVGCVVEIQSKQDSSYQRVCVEGPVFDASEVIW